MYYKYAVNSLARKLNQTKPEFGQLPENVEQCNICVPPTGERVRLPTGARWHLKTGKVGLGKQRWKLRPNPRSRKSLQNEEEI